MNIREAISSPHSWRTEHYTVSIVGCFAKFRLLSSTYGENVC